MRASQPGSYTKCIGLQVFLWLLWLIVVKASLRPARPVTPEVAGSSPVAPVPQISLAVSAAAAGMPPLCSGLMKEVAHFGV